jgi:hypothetical protein
MRMQNGSDDAQGRVERDDGLVGHVRRALEEGSYAWTVDDSFSDTEAMPEYATGGELGDPSEYQEYSVDEIREDLRQNPPPPGPLRQHTDASGYTDPEPSEEER